MRPLLPPLLLVAFLVAGARAQCRVVGPGCSAPSTSAALDLGCRGNANLGCRAFTLVARGLSSPHLLASVLVLSLPPIQPIELAPPLGCERGCFGYAPAILATVHLAPDPLGTSALTLPIPADPAIVGAQLVAQVAAVFGRAVGTTCVVVSPAIEIRISQGPCF